MERNGAPSARTMFFVFETQNPYFVAWKVTEEGHLVLCRAKQTRGYSSVVSSECAPRCFGEGGGEAGSVGIFLWTSSCGPARSRLYRRRSKRDMAYFLAILDRSTIYTRLHKSILNTKQISLELL